MFLDATIPRGLQSLGEKGPRLEFYVDRSDMTSFSILFPISPET